MTTSTLIATQTTSQPVPDQIESVRPATYHRMARAELGYRWSRPLVTFVVAFASYAGLMATFGVATIVASMTNPALEASLASLSAGNLDVYDPVHFFGMLLPLILLLPAVLFGFMAGRRRLGTVFSVAGRMRWGILGRALLVCLGVYAVSYAGYFLAAFAQGEPLVTSWQPYSWWLLAGALFVVPLQAAAEEFAFRALPMQVLGAWLRSPWWGILLPLPFFVIGHELTAVGLLSVAVFALAAGILVWRTGGLEAAIALHVVNNSLVFLFGAIGWGDLNDTSVNLVNVAISTAAVVVSSVLILWVEHNHRKSTELA